MAVQTITYGDKSYLNQNADIPATNKVQDTDMNEIKAVVNNNANELSNNINTLQELNTYSTTEANTGKIWVDGSSIYRKVIVLTGTDIATQNTNINHNITNINEILKLDCIYITSNGARQLPLNYYATNDWDGQLFCTLTQLRFEFGTSALASVQTASHIYVILEYTKTS